MARDMLCIPGMTTIGRKYRNLSSGENQIVKAVKGNRVQVMNTLSGERAWMDAADFAATHKAL